MNIGVEPFTTRETVIYNNTFFSSGTQNIPKQKLSFLVRVVWGRALAGGIRVLCLSWRRGRHGPDTLSGQPDSYTCMSSKKVGGSSSALTKALFYLLSSSLASSFYTRVV